MFVEVDAHVAAAAEHGKCIPAVDHELQAGAFVVVVLLRWLIQSQAQDGPASAMALDKQPERLAGVLRLCQKRGQFVQGRRGQVDGHGHILVRRGAAARGVGRALGPQSAEKLGTRTGLRKGRPVRF